MAATVRDLGYVSVPKPAHEGVEFTGYMEASGNYLTRANHFSDPLATRTFIFSPNGFDLDQFALSLSKLPLHGWGALASIIIGRDANGTFSYGWDPYFGSVTLALDPLELYGQYGFNIVTVMAGKYLSLAGYENVNPLNNNNFTASFMAAFGQPNTHTGARILVIPNEHWKFIAGLNDGWDTIRDWTREKTLELGFKYAPTRSSSLEIQTYTGGQRAQDQTATGPQSMRDLVDVILVINQDQPLSYAVNYDYAIQTKALLADNSIGQAIWQGLAGYLLYTLNDKWKVALRAEVFNDKGGYRTGVNQTLKEATLTFNYLAFKKLLLRMEGRWNWSNVNAYVLANGSSTRQNQQIYSLSAIYQFP